MATKFDSSKIPLITRVRFRVLSDDKIALGVVVGTNLPPQEGSLRSIRVLFDDGARLTYPEDNFFENFIPVDATTWERFFAILGLEVVPPTPDPTPTLPTVAHYSANSIEPITVIRGNKLNFLEGNILKYLLRYKHKGTPVEDLKKLIRYAQWLLEDVEKEEG